MSTLNDPDEPLRPPPPEADPNSPADGSSRSKAGKSSGWFGRGPRSRASSLSLKMLLVATICGAFAVLLDQVQDIVVEREGRYRQVSHEIGRLWGEDQTVAGPLLAIPYTTITNDGEQEGAAYYFLPDNLSVDFEIEPQTRHRGIFQSVVYQLHARVKAQFDATRIAQLVAETQSHQRPGETRRLNWEAAFVSMGLSDMRSIGELVALQVGETTQPFEPGSKIPKLFSQGMSARLFSAESGTEQGTAIDNLFDDGRLEVAVDLVIHGSESARTLPLGKKTQVRMKSSWKDPSFVGAYLPRQHQISTEGFDAEWALSHFGRGYGQILDSARIDNSLRSAIDGSQFGVALYQPVTPYRKVERAIKYGLLFVVFTFAFYFLVEVISTRRIHPVQYATVGVPLCLFYLLLVAFAEHMGFVSAYVLGASCVVALVGWYSQAVLVKRLQWLSICALLATLYLYLYTLLEAESYSLLGGALGLTVLTAGFMFVTRNIDWYSSKGDLK